MRQASELFFFFFHFSSFVAVVFLFPSSPSSSSSSSTQPDREFSKLLGGQSVRPSHPSIQSEEVSKCLFVCPCVRTAPSSFLSFLTYKQTDRQHSTPYSAASESQDVTDWLSAWNLTCEVSKVRDWLHFSPFCCCCNRLTTILLLCREVGDDSLSLSHARAFSSSYMKLYAVLPFFNFLLCFPCSCSSSFSLFFPCPFFLFRSLAASAVVAAAAAAPPQPRSGAHACACYPASPLSDIVATPVHEDHT